MMAPVMTNALAWPLTTIARNFASVMDLVSPFQSFALKRIRLTMNSLSKKKQAKIDFQGADASVCATRGSVRAFWLSENVIRMYAPRVGPARTLNRKRNAAVTTFPSKGAFGR